MPAPEPTSPSFAADRAGPDELEVDIDVAIPDDRAHQPRDRGRGVGEHAGSHALGEAPLELRTGTVERARLADEVARHARRSGARSCGRAR